VEREKTVPRMLNWTGRNDITFVFFVLCVEEIVNFYVVRKETNIYYL
jgi:hypothetical protein